MSEWNIVGNGHLHLHLQDCPESTDGNNSLLRCCCLTVTAAVTFPSICVPFPPSFPGLLREEIQQHGASLYDPREQREDRGGRERSRGARGRRDWAAVVLLSGKHLLYPQHHLCLPSVSPFPVCSCLALLSTVCFPFPCCLHHRQYLGHCRYHIVSQNQNTHVTFSLSGETGLSALSHINTHAHIHMLLGPSYATFSYLLFWLRWRQMGWGLCVSCGIVCDWWRTEGRRKSRKWIAKYSVWISVCVWNVHDRAGKWIFFTEINGFIYFI